MFTNNELVNISIQLNVEIGKTNWAVVINLTKKSKDLDT